MATVFPAQPAPTVAISGTSKTFPVHRIYCVGRNYADHAREMGSDPRRDPPFFFSKPADAVVANHSTVPYPPRTNNLHHEVELVVAIGEAGADLDAAAAGKIIFGYGVGIDLTRRDLQKEAWEQHRPWDTAKGFDASAPIAALTPIAECGPLERGEIWLKVNGETRQRADIADLTWRVPEIIAELSSLFTVKPGDLIFTGTPAGVGKLQPGDRCEAQVAGLETLTITIGPAAR